MYLANRGRVSDMRIMSLFDRAGLLALVGLLAIGSVSIAGAQSSRRVRPRPDDVPQRPAPLPGTLAGSYIGRYECNDRWTSFNLTITETVRGTTAAEAILPLRYIRVRRGSPRANEPTKMQGRVDPASASLTLRTDDEVQLGVKGPEQKLTLQGAIDASNGYFVGTFDYPGCTKFVLVPTTVRGSASYAAELWVTGQRRERAVSEAEAKTAAARDARIRSDGFRPSCVRPADDSSSAATRSPTWTTRSDDHPIRSRRSVRSTNSISTSRQLLQVPRDVDGGVEGDRRGRHHPTFHR